MAKTTVKDLVIQAMDRTDEPGGRDHLHDEASGTIIIVDRDDSQLFALVGDWSSNDLLNAMVRFNYRVTSIIRDRQNER